MGDLLDVLKLHFEYVLIVSGVFFMLGAMLNWKWMNECSTADAGNFWKRFVYENWGVLGFRVLNFLCGLVLALCGILFLFLR